MGSRGPTDLGPLSPGRHLRLLIARAGQYRFYRITRTIHPAYRAQYLYSLTHRRDLYTLEVAPGQVNYPGLFAIQAGPDAGWLGFRMVNRASMVLLEFERSFPKVSSRYVLRYTGRGRDEFLERFARVREAGAKREAPTTSP